MTQLMRFCCERPGMGAPAIEDERHVAQRAFDTLEGMSHGASRVVRTGVHEEPECFTQSVTRGDELVDVRLGRRPSAS